MEIRYISKGRHRRIDVSDSLVLIDTGHGAIGVSVGTLADRNNQEHPVQAIRVSGDIESTMLQFNGESVL